MPFRRMPGEYETKSEMFPLVAVSHCVLFLVVSLLLVSEWKRNYPGDWSVGGMF